MEEKDNGLVMYIRSLFVFDHLPIWWLIGNVGYAVHLRLIGKVAVDFLFVLIVELFTLDVTVHTSVLKERPPLYIAGWQMRALGPATFKETFGMPYWLIGCNAS